MSAGAAILANLAARRSVAERVAIVAAHPDDETIGLGAQLCRFQNALLVHVTDGAPRDGRDAAAYGFASVSDYAVARRAELTATLVAGNASHIRTLCLGIVDQAAVHHLGDLTRRLRNLFEQEKPQAVITHAYEGGHPDHDATAFTVHAACRLLPNGPSILEMALYHRDGGRLVSGDFLGSPGSHVCCTSVELDQEEIRRKQRMIDCFATQRWLLMQLDWTVERLRIAPDYDFCVPPHPGELHYETLGWGIAGAAWRRCAISALVELGCR